MRLKDISTYEENGRFYMKLTYGKAAKSKTFYGDTVISCTDCARCEMVYKRISEAMEEIND